MIPHALLTKPARQLEKTIIFKCLFVFEIEQTGEGQRERFTEDLKLTAESLKFSDLNSRAPTART